jgi:NADH-quinone oxidoreductase subunit A
MLWDPDRVFCCNLLCDKIHKVRGFRRFQAMAVLPIFLFVLCAALVALVLVAIPALVAPHRTNPVKEMPYESGMDPIHDTRRRFDVRFYLVAIAFLVFDVELLFLYPWAVASRNPEGIDRAVANQWVENRQLVFIEVLAFVALLAAGFVYAWRKGVFRWR